MDGELDGDGGVMGEGFYFSLRENSANGNCCVRLNSDGFRISVGVGENRPLPCLDSFIRKGGLVAFGVPLRGIPSFFPSTGKESFGEEFPIWALRSLRQTIDSSLFTMIWLRQMEEIQRMHSVPSLPKQGRAAAPRAPLCLSQRTPRECLNPLSWPSVVLRTSTAACGRNGIPRSGIPT